VGAKGTGNAVDWWGLEQVLSGYDLHTENKEKVYYSVWQSSIPKFFYSDGDIVGGRDYLERNISPLEHNGSTALYTIRFHPEPADNDELTNKSPVTGSANFKMCQYYDQGRNGVRSVSGGSNNEALVKIAEMLQQQNDRLTALEQGENEEEETEEDYDSDIGRAIHGVKQIEAQIQSSPLLGGLYTDGRLLLRGLCKKWGIPLDNVFNDGAINGVTMENVDTSKDTENFKELVKNFPELPAMLRKLYMVMKNDPVTFEFAKKKLKDGIEQL
jgi:hypothetical protein